MPKLEVETFFRQEDATPPGLARKNVVVIDVLRATSTLATAFAAGIPMWWTAPAIGIAAGANTVVVHGTNDWGWLTNDSVVITRSAYTPANVEQFEVSSGAMKK